MTMAHQGNAEQKALIDEMSRGIGRASKSWARIQRALADWDLTTLAGVSAPLGDGLIAIASVWQDKSGVLNDAAQAVRDFVTSDEYVQQLESALRNAPIPIQGEFPRYEFPPFRLDVDREGGVARLLLGRKQEKTTALLPVALAKWVASRYQRIVNQPFSKDQFCRDLLLAYEYASRLMFQERSVLWGRPVSLRQLYDLLTLRRSAKQDYPLPLFQHQLARLKEEFDVRYDGHRFEFGFSREQSRAFVVVDRSGREHRISSLTIHAKEEPS